MQDAGALAVQGDSQPTIGGHRQALARIDIEGEHAGQARSLQTKVAAVDTLEDQMLSLQEPLAPVLSPVPEYVFGIQPAR